MNGHNPQAFPSMAPLEHWGDPSRGMDLRDWFAGQVLAGIARSSVNTPAVRAGTAEWAYDMADAMLAARNTGAQS